MRDEKLSNCNLKESLPEFGIKKVWPLPKCDQLIIKYLYCDDIEKKQFSHRKIR